MTAFREHENWTSRFAFLMAAVGAAVGLGNIWKFPYITGQNGGSAFVLVYLLSVVFVALPILIAEIMLGRWGRQSPPRAMAIGTMQAGHTDRLSTRLMGVSTIRSSSIVTLPVAPVRRPGRVGHSSRRPAAGAVLVIRHAG